MKRRAPRGLDPEEKDLWDRVAKTAKPLQPNARASVASITKKPTSPTGPRDSIAPFEVGSKGSVRLPDHNLAPPIAQQVGALPVTMDKKAFRRLKRGQSRPEARLDLHGMTVAAAHDALLSFIHSSHASGKRLVLVITGKGRRSADDGPIPTRTGVLKHQVPHWLTSAPLARMILQVSQAHRRHGGAGALYVYLRRG